MENFAKEDRKMRYLIYYVAMIGACVLEVWVTTKYVKRIFEGCDKLQKISEKRIEFLGRKNFWFC